MPFASWEHNEVLVISPHLDDAVLSVGQVIGAHPGAVVVTVFAGMPPTGSVNEYDNRCGFSDGSQAIRHRRKEDIDALSMLRAQPVHLDVLSAQYSNTYDDAEIIGRIDQLITELQPACILGPVGLIHPDHVCLGRLWPLAASRHPDVPAYAYEELPYRIKARRRAIAAAQILVSRYQAKPAELPMCDLGVKAQAMLHYVSQLQRVFPPACLTSEALWKLW
jgi:LmbE family N-acetylglucosaminyl deacetylase